MASWISLRTVTLRSSPILRLRCLRKPNQDLHHAVRRVRQVYEGREEPSGSHEPDVPPGLDEPFSAPAAEPIKLEEDAPPQDAIPAPEPATDGLDLEGAVTGAQENKRELEAESNSLKPTNLQLQALMKQRQRKESTAKDFQGKDAGRLQRAIQKEIRKNMETGA